MISITVVRCVEHCNNTESVCVDDGWDARSTVL